MAPEEDSKPETTQPEAAGPRPVGRRDRRPSRGRRGRGRGRRPKPPQTGPGLAGADTPAPAEPGEVFELAEDTPPVAEAESSSADTFEPGLEPLPTRSEPIPPGRPAPPASVEEAIEEVSNIVETLRGALDGMEEVLELLELYERQKNLDEREIDSLRRALRQMHRPRDAGHHPHR